MGPEEMKANSVAKTLVEEVMQAENAFAGATLLAEQLTSFAYAYRDEPFGEALAAIISPKTGAILYLVGNKNPLAFTVAIDAARTSLPLIETAMAMDKAKAEGEAAPDTATRLVRGWVLARAFGLPLDIALKNSQA